MRGQLRLCVRSTWIIARWLARFIPEQKALLVITANQTIYSIDLSSSEQTHVVTTEAK